MRGPRVALALGGGGALGVGHIPVLEALDDLGIRPVGVAGTSMGAILGACVASGMSAAEIRREILRYATRPFDTLRLISGSIKPPGWSRAIALAPDLVVEKLLPAAVPQRFSELPVPFTAVATDWHARTEVPYATGPLRPAIAASIAIPLVFRPVERDGRVLVDGGLTNNVPFDHLPEADIVLAVDVATAPVEIGNEPPSMMETAIGSIRVMMTAMLEARLRHSRPDILIRPAARRFGPLDFNKMPEILEAAAPARLETRQRLAECLGA